MFPIAVPVPTFRRADGRLDRSITEKYASRLCETWVQTVIVAGPAGLGEQCTARERADQVRLWRDHADGLQLVAACWERDDYRTAEKLDVRPLAILQVSSAAELTHLVTGLPPNAIAYANPRYSKSLLTPELLARVADGGAIPSAVKLSKVTHEEIAAVRRATDKVKIWHGSSRNIAASLEAGADVVVAPPLAVLPTPWPPAHIEAVQRRINDVQAHLDALPSHYARVGVLAELAADRARTGDPALRSLP